MGGVAASKQLSDWTSEELAEAVGDLGTAGSKYCKYAQAIRENAVDGDFLVHSLVTMEEDINDLFDDLGITIGLHRRVLARKWRCLCDVAVGDGTTGTPRNNNVIVVPDGVASRAASDDVPKVSAADAWTSETPVKKRRRVEPPDPANADITSSVASAAPKFKAETTRQEKKNGRQEEAPGVSRHYESISSATSAVATQVSTNSSSVVRVAPEIKAETASTTRQEKANEHQEEANAAISSDVSAATQVTNTSSVSTVCPEVKAEMTRQEKAKERKTLYQMHGDRHLLHRHKPLGIARLGGNLQETHVFPSIEHANLKHPDYPTPKTIDYNDPDRRKYYGYHAYNATWQPNGPMFAGQPTAAVDAVADFFKESGTPFPIFMKRSLTKLTSKREGPLLGWEYVGNYRAVKDDEIFFWESAANFSEASKHEIADKTFNSSRSEGGYGRRILNHWRNRLIEELENDDSPPAPQYMIDRRPPTHDEAKEATPPIAARARALGFNAEMSDKDLSELVVNLDEYHGQIVIRFVEYDERTYNFCVGGKTNKTKDGRTLSPNSKQVPARAKDWYEFAEQNMLFRY